MTMAYLWIFCIAWSCVLALSIFVLPYKYLVPTCCQKTCLLGMMGYGVNGSSCPMIQFVHYFGLQTVKINLFTCTIWFWKRSQVVYVVSSDLTPQGSYGLDRKKICTRGEFYCWFDIFDHWAKFYVGQNFAF